MWLPAIGNLKIRGTHCRRTPRKVTRSAEGHHLKMTLWFPIEPLSEKMAAKSQPSYFFNLSNLASQLILATFPRTTGSRTIISWGRRSQSWTLEEKMGRASPASHQFQTRSASTQTFLDSCLYQKETLLQKNMKHQFSAVMVQNELLYHHNWGFSSWFLEFWVVQTDQISFIPWGSNDQTLKFSTIFCISDEWIYVPMFVQNIDSTRTAKTNPSHWSFHWVSHIKPYHSWIPQRLNIWWLGSTKPKM